MKTLIAYFSRHGCTKKCVGILADYLDSEIDFIDLSRSSASDVDVLKYDSIILGSPVYYGNIAKEVKSFAESESYKLKQKKLGLFTCGMQDQWRAKEQIESNYPKELLDIAETRACFGGEYHFDRMSLMEKMITRKVAKVNKDVSTVDEEAIKAFAETMNKVNLIGA